MRGELEKRLLQDNILIAGVDEVGRGCIAGPVVASCVVLDYDIFHSLEDKEKKLIRDSKTLSLKQRLVAKELILKTARSYAICEAKVREIESEGIVGATFLAMSRAIARVSANLSIEMLLVDGNKPIPNCEIPQKTVVKGDNLCFSIAAASILAKLKRDDYMIEVAKMYPQYGFEKHMGYGTKLHRDSLIESGYCPLHRKNFEPISSMI